MVQCMSAQEVEKLQRVFLSIDQTKEGTVRYWELEEWFKKSLEMNKEKLD